MSSKQTIEITPEDEITIVGYRELERLGHGSRPTIWRKVKNKNFPAPIDDGKWTLAEIKRYVERKLQQVAA